MSMQPLPLVYPHAVIFWLVYGLFYCQEVSVLTPRKPKRDESWQQDRGSYRLIMGGLWICACIAFYGAVKMPGAGFQSGRVGWFRAGVILIAAGTGSRRHCFTMLGRHFRPVVSVTPDQPVIDRGAYHWVRHPSYLASILVMLGMGLALTNWISLIVLGIVPLGIVAYRIQVEERALVETLGQPYRDYMTRTKRLVPFLF
jgi:protein-S-isoprenylcysteine O-methyltransferase Ste14